MKNIFFSNQSLIKNVTGTLLLVLLCGLLLTYFLTDIHSVFTLEYLRSQQGVLSTSINKHPFLAMGLFTLLYISVVTLSLPVASILSVAAGFLFGMYYGVIIVVISAAIGASIVFISARYFLREWFIKLFRHHMERIDIKLEDNAFSYILSLRLIPFFPFFLINVSLAITQVPMRTYVFATLIGIIPGSIIYVLAGRQLASIITTTEILTFENLMVLTLLGLVALTPTLWKRHRDRPSFIGH